MITMIVDHNLVITPLVIIDHCRRPGERNGNVDEQCIQFWDDIVGNGYR